jgi:hypothetical protein
VPFLVTAQLQSEVRFTEFTRAVEAAVNKALYEGAVIALEEIRARARVGDDPRGPGPHFAKPNDSGPTHHKDSFQVTVRRLFRGAGAAAFDLVVWTENPNAVWQELGTRGRRQKRMKSGEARRGGGGELDSALFGGNRGVAPSYFMRRGFQAAEPKIAALVLHAISEVGSYATTGVAIDTTSPHFFRGSSSKFFGGRR